MINNGKFYVVTSDLMSMSFFSSFKKEGISLDIVPNLESASKLLLSHQNYQSIMVLVDISTNENHIFEALRTFVSIFPSKQIVCYSESIDLEQIRKTKELSIPSVVTKNDFQKLFALLIPQ